MMHREFTTREKILLLVLCFIMLAVFYYEIVVKNVEENIQRYDTSELEIELMMEQQKAMQIQSMEQEMAILKESGSLVPTYNNIKSTIRELNDIFDGAQEYHFEFGKAVRDGDAVRRDISITFSASSYARAEAIIQKLHDCKYRCQIRTLSISSGNESGGVSASLQVTFYETMYEASSTLGLEEAKNEAQTPEDLT